MIPAEHEAPATWVQVPLGLLVGRADGVECLTGHCDGAGNCGTESGPIGRRVLTNMSVSRRYGVDRYFWYWNPVSERDLGLNFLEVPCPEQGPCIHGTGASYPHGRFLRCLESTLPAAVRELLKVAA